MVVLEVARNVDAGKPIANVAVLRRPITFVIEARDRFRYDLMRGDLRKSLKGAALIDELYIAGEVFCAYGSKKRARKSGVREIFAP